MKIVLGADHAGFATKEFLKKNLKSSEKKYEIVDVGTHSTDSVDYPDIAKKAAKRIKENPKQYVGILVCGSGIGISIAANKVKGIRAARACTKEDAKLARRHNNANVITLPGRKFAKRTALELATTFIETSFSDEERHKRRIKKIARIEK